jgi:hypothetical protein
MSEAINEAKEALLRALDQLDKAEQDLDGPVKRVDLIVTYCIGADLGDGGWHEIAGWASTGGPKWVHAALLRRAANAQDATYLARDIDIGDELDDDADFDDPPMP